MLGHMADLHLSAGPAQAREDIKKASVTAYKPEADWEALQKTQIALGGRLYAVPEVADSVFVSHASESLRPQRAIVQPPTQTSITVIYVNGVMATPLDAGEGLLEVQRLGNELGWRFVGADTPYSLRYFYNRSYAYQLNKVNTCALAFARQWALNVLVVTDLALHCLPLNDFHEAASQLINIGNGFSSDAQADAQALSAAIDEGLGPNRAVIVVAHSQGNLMTQEAINSLSGPKSCVGVISLAAPTSAGWSDEIQLTGLAVKGQEVGDMILDLGLNFFPATRTNISDRIDDVIRSASNPIEAVLWPIFGKIDLHYVDNYFAGDRSRELIKGALATEAAELRARCGVPDPGTIEEACAVAKASLPGTYTLESRSGWFFSSGTLELRSDSTWSVVVNNFGGRQDSTYRDNGVWGLQYLPLGCIVAPNPEVAYVLQADLSGTVTGGGQVIIGIPDQINKPNVLLFPDRDDPSSFIGAIGQK